ATRSIRAAHGRFHCPLQAGAAFAPEDLERQAGDPAALDEPACAICHAAEAAPGEEAHVRRVEDAAVVVVEAPETDPQAWIPVADVRDTRDENCVGRTNAVQVAQEPIGISQVLE